MIISHIALQRQLKMYILQHIENHLILFDS